MKSGVKIESRAQKVLGYLQQMSQEGHFKKRNYSSAVNTSFSVRGVWGSIPRLVKLDTVSPTARHHCDVFFELCCPGTMQQRWASPLITRFGVIPRVLYDDLIFFERKMLSIRKKKHSDSKKKKKKMQTSPKNNHFRNMFLVVFHP